MSETLTRATPNGHAATLFDRKLRLADQFSCRQLFADLEQADAAVVAALAAKLDAESRVARAKAELEDLATLAGLAVEGKNEAERKARRVEALGQDVGYRAALAAQHEAEAALARAEADFETAKRNARRLEMRIRYNTAVLEVLTD